VGLGVDTGRQTQGPAATLAFNFSPKLFRGSDQPSSFYRKLRANSVAYDSKYGGAHGQGDVEIGAHSKNR
jgi:hypothetical protein